MSSSGPSKKKKWREHFWIFFFLIIFFSFINRHFDWQHRVSEGPTTRKSSRMSAVGVRWCPSTSIGRENKKKLFFSGKKNFFKNRQKGNENKKSSFVGFYRVSLDFDGFFFIFLKINSVHQKWIPFAGTKDQNGGLKGEGKWRLLLLLLLLLLGWGCRHFGAPSTFEGHLEVEGEKRWKMVEKQQQQRQQIKERNYGKQTVGRPPADPVAFVLFLLLFLSFLFFRSKLCVFFCFFFSNPLRSSSTWANFVTTGNVSIFSLFQLPSLWSSFTKETSKIAFVFHLFFLKLYSMMSAFGKKIKNGKKNVEKIFRKKRNAERVSGWSDVR